MKFLVALMVCLTAFIQITCCQAPIRSIKITKSSQSRSFRKELDTTVDSALVLASSVFNAKEFQNRIYAMNFDSESRCLGDTSCTSNEPPRSAVLPGIQVLDRLFSEPNVTLTCTLKRRSASSLGKTCPRQYSITAFYKNIMRDMSDDPMSPAYKIAVNICHEYMHQIGFCHTYSQISENGRTPDSRYYKKDVSYTVGWEAYYILKRWFEERKTLKGL